MVLLGIGIGIAFFAGLVALLGASYHHGSAGVQAGAAAAHEHTAAPGGNECLLCQAPLPRHGTPDEAVTEIERRIAENRSDAGGALAHGAGRLAGSDR